MGHAPPSRRLHSERPILPSRGRSRIVWEWGGLGTLSLDFPVLAEEECSGDQACEGAFRCSPGSACTLALTAAAGCCALAGLTPKGGKSCRPG